MIRFVYLVLGGVLLMGSCHKKKLIDKSQNEIYCDYQLFYDQNEDKTHAVARFRMGGEMGSLIELVDSTNASVLFNGDKLPYDVWYGGHHKAYLGQIKEGVFVYTNTNGTVYKNTVPSGSIVSFPDDFDTIKKGVNQSLLWEGDVLEENEKVSLFVGTWTWGECAEYYADEIGDNNIALKAGQIESLSTGVSTLFLDRTKSVDITQGTIYGGTISYKYRCTNKDVEVVE